MASFARLIFLAFVVVSGSAWSATTYQGSTAFYSPAPLTSIPDAGAELQRILEGSKFPVIVKDKDFIKIGNTKIPIQVTRKVPAQGAARAAIRAGGVRAAVVVAAVTAAWCKYETGSFLCDERQPMQDQNVWVYQGSPSAFPTAGTPMGAAQAAANMLFPGQDASISGCVFQNPTLASCYGKKHQWNATYKVWGPWEDFGVGVIVKPGKLCPAVINFFDPRYTIPGGPEDADGKCPTGRYAPVAEPEAEHRLEAQLQKAPDASKVVQGLLEDGVDLTPVADPLPKVATGPATAQEAPVTRTVTSPTGQPQTTTTQTTYNIKYGDNYTMTWNSTTVTNHPDGTTETQTEEPKDEKSECEKNPDVIGCQKTDVPNAPDIQKKEIPVSYAPQSGWGSDNAACPAPPAISILGYPVVLDMSLFCMFFAGIRFAVVGMAALAGALIFMGGLKN